MTEYLVSVVIPFFNEEATAEPLFQRIDQTFQTYKIPYEIIAVDDASTDRTLALLQHLHDHYPLTILTKPNNRRRGKAFSLLQGFQHIHSSVVVMIDGDLQYPPEAIPGMLAKLSEADLIVAERTKKEASLPRKFMSSISHVIFSKLLHGISVDTQSGLKVIRHEILQRVTLHPTSWTFDLELLVKAQHAGYTITTQPITMAARLSREGKSNSKFISVAADIVLSSLRLKSKRPDVIPFLPSMIASQGQGFHYKGQKYIPHNTLAAHETALYRLAYRQRWILLILGIMFGAWLVVNWHSAIVAIVAGLTVLYFADLIFNLYLIYRSTAHTTEVQITREELQNTHGKNWPTYTIFCPLYKEHEVIPQFVNAMSKLDYPADKLQIMLLLEEDDKVTIAKAQSMQLPSFVEIVVVPHSMPKTKPKACNYGLLKATGEYVVIYDAEDVPDPDQLKKAILAFEKLGDDVACIQSKLNFYNPHQNLLTRAFTTEYSLWFDLVLTGLQSIKAPIPLGGTSNHFRRAQLVHLSGWDAFNVTEDCDLGIRLVKRGMYTAVLDSTTLEEANSDLPNWFSQRSRWIKGYMQTYLVHMRNPSQFLKEWRKPHVLTFQLIVGGKILSMFINPLMWVTTISYFAARSVVGPTIESFFPTAVFYMAIFSLVMGNFLYVYYYMIGCLKRNQDELVKFAFLMPFYWLMMSMAAWIAVKDLIIRPHHWAKTKHGLHLNNKKGLEQTKAKIGNDFNKQEA